MRGVPGSGKSTKAKELRDSFVRDGYQTSILSTDDWFMCDQVYMFEPKQISTAHAWNQARAKKLAGRGQPVIIIDNTCMQLWEMRAYLEIAEQHQYGFETYDVGSGDLEVCAVRNQHGVPLAAIQKMAASYQPFQDGISQIKGARAPWESGR